eukprot:TRINITY_DN6346_c0_g2_i1.p1 TRINITY_DN6346_c0_g2~~TRINITY_DN6346_c0_g2_i1.p1  ORF type:complete len:251 (+),score=-15.76 TRINITY_DN6346_c0_g2_i1:35-754(+)
MSKNCQTGIFNSIYIIENTIYKNYLQIVIFFYIFQQILRYFIKTFTYILSNLIHTTLEFKKFIIIRTQYDKKLLHQILLYTVILQTNCYRNRFDFFTCLCSKYTGAIKICEIYLRTSCMHMQQQYVNMHAYEATLYLRTWSGGRTNQFFVSRQLLKFDSFQIQMAIKKSSSGQTIDMSSHICCKCTTTFSHTKRVRNVAGWNFCRALVYSESCDIDHQYDKDRSNFVREQFLKQGSVFV